MIKTLRPIPVEQLQLLIFDLDGTLIDSRVDLTNSVNAMLRHFGRNELPCEVIGTYIGDGAPMLVRRALGDPDDQKFLELADECAADFLVTKDRALLDLGRRKSRPLSFRIVTPKEFGEWVGG